ncbi:MAG: hypothetical protein H0V96_04185 [Acidimicrobiia bacterium]|nr:hypothetical protein [Acidimicrobiia bacterium]
MMLGPLAMSMVLTSCGGGTHSVESGDYTIYVHGSSLLPRGGTDAGIEGTLALRGSCVVLEAGNEVWFPVVWPAGTSIASDDPFVISLPSDQEVAVGEGVSGSGGYYQPGNLDMDVPQECLPETNEFAVFNPDDEVETAAGVGG